MEGRNHLQQTRNTSKRRRMWKGKDSTRPEGLEMRQEGEEEDGVLSSQTYLVRPLEAAALRRDLPEGDADGGEDVPGGADAGREEEGGAEGDGELELEFESEENPGSGAGLDASSNLFSTTHLPRNLLRSFQKVSDEVS